MQNSYFTQIIKNIYLLIFRIHIPESIFKSNIFITLEYGCCKKLFLSNFSARHEQYPQRCTGNYNRNILWRQFWTQQHQSLQKNTPNQVVNKPNANIPKLRGNLLLQNFIWASSIVSRGIKTKYSPRIKNFEFRSISVKASKRSENFGNNEWRQNSPAKDTRSRKKSYWKNQECSKGKLEISSRKRSQHNIREVGNKEILSMPAFSKAVS